MGRSRRGRQPRLRGCVLFLLASSVVARTARAGTDVEVFAALGPFSASMDAVYDASYVPSRVVGINQLFEGPDPRSRASQSLALRGQPGIGFGIGLNVYPHPVLGIQLRLDRAHSDLAGANPPHRVDLTYDTIAFPSSDRVVRTLSYSFEVPDTSGRLERLALSLNALARWRAGAFVSGSVSGGVSAFRLRATGLEVGALAAWIGGHAVVFSELYRMSLDTESAVAVGFDVGGDVGVRLGGDVVLFLDGRYFHGPRTAAAPRLQGPLSDNVVSVPIGRIEDFLSLPPVDLDPSAFSLLLGLKVGF